MENSNGHKGQRYPYAANNSIPNVPKQNQIKSSNSIDSIVELQLGANLFVRQ